MTVTGLGAAMGGGAAVWYLRKKKQFARMYIDVTSDSVSTQKFTFLKNSALSLVLSLRG